MGMTPYYQDELTTMYNGDCLSVMKELETESIDCILTDPPYGMNWQSGHRKVKYDKIQNDSDLLWVDDWLKESFRLLKQDRTFYSFCSWHNVDIFKQKIEACFELKNILIWYKNNHGSGDLTGNYAPIYENILFATKGNPKLFGKRVPNILEFDRTINEFHPTEKPVSLISLLVEKSCRNDYVVLDMYAGSGTTGVACKQMGVKSILIEREEKYCKTALDRLSFRGLGIDLLENVFEQTEQQEFKL